MSVLYPVTIRTIARRKRLQRVSLKMEQMFNISPYLPQEDSSVLTDVVFG